MQRHAIIRVFDALDHGEQARAALLGQGFQAHEVHLTVRDDEAGAVEGNFAVGNSPVESDGHIYARNYARPRQRSNCLLQVDAADAAKAAQAATILEEHGGRDPDFFTP